MKIIVELGIDLEVEVDDKFQALDVPISQIKNRPSKDLRRECMIAAKKEIEKKYPHYKDFEVYSISNEFGNEIAEF